MKILKKNFKKAMCLGLVLAFIFSLVPSSTVSASMASEAKKLTLKSKTTLSKSIADDTSHYYKFTLDRKTKITFTATESSIDNWYLRVYKKNGSNIWSDSRYDGDWTYNQVYDNWKLKKELVLPKGTYFIEIENCTGHTIKYNFKIKVEPTLKVSKMTIRLKKGKTFKFGEYVDLDGKIKWSTSKRTIATVTQNGTIKGKKKGTAVITAHSKSTNAKVLLTVKVQ